MIIYIIRRVLIFIPMLLAISFLVYGALELTPGDAVSALINPEVSGRLTEAQFNELREAYGLNKSFLARYGIWLANVFQGNFGHSLAGGVPISTIFLDRLPATLELSVVALLFSTIMGCILGTFSALKRGSIADSSLTVVGMLGVSIPEFFFGLVALLIFALNLGWLPVGGRLLPGYDSIWDRAPHIIMPAMVLSLMMTAGVMRYARSSMLDALSKEFIKTARSKGLPEWRINLMHGFRVALTPVVVLIGFRLPLLIGGSVIIEQVFQWPGMGLLFLDSIRYVDIPVMSVYLVLIALMFVVINLLVDLLYFAIDPRVRLKSGHG